jgi:hypothetical protein
MRVSLSTTVGAWTTGGPGFGFVVGFELVVGFGLGVVECVGDAVGVGVGVGVALGDTAVGDVPVGTCTWLVVGPAAGVGEEPPSQPLTPSPSARRASAPSRPSRT